MSTWYTFYQPKLHWSISALASYSDGILLHYMNYIFSPINMTIMGYTILHVCRYERRDEIFVCHFSGNNGYKKSLCYYMSYFIFWPTAWKWNGELWSFQNLLILSIPSPLNLACPSSGRVAKLHLLIEELLQNLIIWCLRVEGSRFI